MYAGFYGLSKEPFHITPDPEFLFLSPSHKQALASIIYGIEERKGFVGIIGEVGVGKTTILRSYLESADKQRLKIIYLFNPNLTFQALLRIILRELELEPGTDDVAEMVNLLHHRLIEEYSQDRNVVLIIDEAQNMPVSTMEDLRMLSNLETSKDKLLQIVLIGQPELENILNRNELRQLRQRIAIYSTITPLTRDEGLAYIGHRLRKVTTSNDAVFTDGALQTIVKEAKGIPRVINILCDNSLINGFGYQQKPVTSKIVREVIADLGGKPRPLFSRWKLAIPLLLTVSVSLGWLVYQKYPSLSSAQHPRLSQVLPEVIPETRGPSSPMTAPVDSVRRPLPAVATNEDQGDSGTRMPILQEARETSSRPQFSVQAAAASSDQTVDPAVSAAKDDPGTADAPMPSAGAKDQAITVASHPTTSTVPAVESSAYPVDHETPAGPLLIPDKKLSSAPSNDPGQSRQKRPPAWTIKKGETLTKIANQVIELSHEKTTPEHLVRSILQINPQIKNADIINPGDRILLPPLNAPETGDLYP